MAPDSEAEVQEALFRCVHDSGKGKAFMTHMRSAEEERKKGLGLAKLRPSLFHTFAMWTVWVVRWACSVLRSPVPLWCFA
jgi:hypothetical protein